MEWVETTGKSIEEAIDSALDQLGVDDADAEYEVISDAKTGMFGRVKAEARIRARVRPTAPPSKDAANNTRRRRNNRERAPRQSSNSREAVAQVSIGESDDSSSSSAATTKRPTETKSSRSRNRRKPAAERQGVTEVAEEDVPLERQGEVAVQFLRGLLAETQVAGDVSSYVQPEDEIVQVAVGGGNLGHLIGPKGATLQSLQELTRTVVQRQTGARNGRVIVDVGAYREKRRVALERFSKEVAEDVLTNGGTRQLEPMNPADRKVVHDTVNDIVGVSTTSEGEEPHRYVVVRPDTQEG